MNTLDEIAFARAYLAGAERWHSERWYTPNWARELIATWLEAGAPPVQRFSASRGEFVALYQEYATPAQAAPVVTVPPEWSPIATYNGGSLRLTPQGRRLLTNTLAEVAAFMTRQGRDLLVSDFPEPLRDRGLRRDTNNARVDLGVMIESIESWNQLSSGEWALVNFVEKASILTHPDPVSNTLRQIAAAIRAVLPRMQGQSV